MVALTLKWNTIEPFHLWHNIFHLRAVGSAFLQAWSSYLLCLPYDLNAASLSATNQRKLLCGASCRRAESWQTHCCTDRQRVEIVESRRSSSSVSEERKKRRCCGMLNLFKALCVYLKCILTHLSWCFYEDESILKQAATHKNMLTFTVSGNRGKCSKWYLTCDASWET